MVTPPVRVLLVDDDAATLQTFKYLLTEAGYEFLGADTARKGIELAHTGQPDLAIVDFFLPDLTGIEVLRAIRNTCSRTATVLVTGFWSLEVEFESKAAGASACVSKPIIGDEVIEMARRALGTRVDEIEAAGVEARRTPGLVPGESHCAKRLTEIVSVFLGAQRDERTLRGFGSATGISRGGFRNWCRASRLRPKSVLDFARGLRAVCRQGRNSEELTDVLDIIDDRTLRRFVTKSGGKGLILPSTVEEYLARQTFIKNPDLIEGMKMKLLRAQFSVGRSN